MSKSDLTISLNEVLFFFTRAGFGVNAPIGVAEDFARSNIWIAENGFDPCCCSIEALDNLDNHESDLAVQFKQTDTQSRFFCPGNEYLSALIASVSAVDWMSIDNQTGQLILENVDSPLLVIAAIGANQCYDWQALWLDESNHEYLVNFAEPGVWEMVSSNTQPIELSKGATMIIQPLLKTNKYPVNAVVRKFVTVDEKEKILQRGVKVGKHWQGIYDYFSRCLVKSTAESRASGAGAGMVDTD